jgi:hypothetical protein
MCPQFWFFIVSGSLMPYPSGCLAKLNDVVGTCQTQDASDIDMLAAISARGA